MRERVSKFSPMMHWYFSSHSAAENIWTLLNIWTLNTFYEMIKTVKLIDAKQYKFVKYVIF